jgi:hypothetical protein
MLQRIAIAAMLAAQLMWAQRQISVADLETFIKSTIQLKQQDRQVADMVKTMRLTQKLELGTVETWQGLGAGPRTVEALKLLATASASLATPPPPTPFAAVLSIPPPTAAEQRAVLGEVTQNSLEYSRNLPNFICTQVTRRSVDPGDGGWRPQDVIQEQLSFVDGKESYKVVLVNNLAVQNVGHEQLGGTTSSGEFGTMLAQIFAPKTGAIIKWERWGTLRGRRMHVFEFRVLQRDSEYAIYHEASGRRIVAGYRGLLYADAESKMIMRIKMDMEGLENFPIHRVSLDLNYDFVEISGQQFVLPLKAELTSQSGRFGTRNEVEFRRFSRFSADAKIIFDVPEELPDGQLEEQPIR